MPRYSVSRQKACIACSDAKLRCDRKTPCTRCSDRQLQCERPSPGPRSASVRRRATNDHVRIGCETTDPSLCGPVIDLLDQPSGESEDPTSRTRLAGSPVNLANNIITQPPLSLPTPTDSDHFSLSDAGRRAETSQTADPSVTDLVCPIDAEAIKNRWLTSFIPNPDQPVKQYSTFVIQFVSKILQSYVGVSVNAQGWPAFVHHTQARSVSHASPLHTCLNLIRLLQSSAGHTMDVIEREMEMVYRSHETHNQTMLLAAFQAYLVYSMALYFCSDQVPTPVLRQAIINLQDLACASSRQGLVSVAEQQAVLPRWQDWIDAESKRRTLYIMYLLDSILSARDGLPSHLATELFGLPAPSKKHVWEARTQSEWETAYNGWLTQTPLPLRLDELWPAPTELDEPALLKRRQRVDSWLEGVDEFGTMLFAVTSCTHGC